MVRRTTLLAVLAVFTVSACEAEAPKPEVSFKPITDVRETMEWILDPAADVLWASAGTIITIDESRELHPTTDEGWAHVRNNAAVVAEAGNLLMMPSRAIDNEDWMEYSRALVDMGVLAMKAADAQDSDALFDAGAKLYSVCSACHQAYIHNVE
ncbi:MAG: hypothetical protein O7G86_00025 [Gammaproteobacteria bacterium]|nr:hypothetical protein [Gammaproteobacteria bacterium]